MELKAVAWVRHTQAIRETMQETMQATREGTPKT
jgi:hypothetical protein